MDGLEREREGEGEECEVECKEEKEGWRKNGKEGVSEMDKEKAV